MSRLVTYVLLLLGLVLKLETTAQAQRRSRQGQALLAHSSHARYHRAPIHRDYFKPPRRAHYHYAPSYHAYFNRSPYRPRTYRYRRPAVAVAHP